MRYTLIEKLTHAMLRLYGNYCFTSLVLSPSCLVLDCTFILSLLRLVSILLPGKVVEDVCNGSQAMTMEVGTRERSRL